MTHKAYILNRPDGDVTQPVNKAKVMDLTGRYMKPRGPDWRIKVDPEEQFGPWRQDWDLIRTRWSNILDSAKIGGRLRLDGEHGAYQLLVHVVDDDPPVTQTEGNDFVDAIHTWVAQEYQGKWRSGGICVKKTIIGSGGTPSQHNPWVHGGDHGEGGANAEDYFLDSMNMMYEMAERAVRERHQPDLPVGLSIVGNRIWTPSSGWHPYSGEFHYHVHLEGWQSSSGAIRAAC